MSINESLISEAFQTFLKDAPEQSEVWMNLFKDLAAGHAVTQSLPSAVETFDAD